MLGTTYGISSIEYYDFEYGFGKLCLVQWVFIFYTSFILLCSLTDSYQVIHLCTFALPISLPAFLLSTSSDPIHTSGILMAI